MSLLSRWKSIFSPAPESLPVLGLEGLDKEDASGKTIVLGRGLYRVRWMALNEVPISERRTALKHLCLAWQPFDDPEYRVQLQAQGALVMAWDRRLRDTLGNDAEVIPESCLRPVPEDDGLRMLQADEGFEAELWVNGALRASRWWPAEPGDEEAQQWLRSLGALADQRTLPMPLEAKRLTRPAWSVQSLEQLTRSGSPVERLAAIAFGICFSALAGAAAMQAWYGHEQLQKARQVQAQQRLALAPLKAIRDEAVQLQARAAQAHRAFAQPAALDLLAHLGTVLKPGVELRELELKGMQVRLVVSWPTGIARSSLLQDLQAGGWLYNVKEVGDGRSLPAGQMAVAGELRGVTPYPADVAAASPASPSSAPPSGASSGSPPQFPLPRAGGTP